MWRRGGMVRVKTERVKYAEPTAATEAGMAIVTAPMPPDFSPSKAT